MQTLEQNTLTQHGLDLSPALAATSPIDFASELDINIECYPYTPEDPLGWVRGLGEDFWAPVQEQIETLLSALLSIEHKDLPGYGLYDTWAAFDTQRGEWLPIQPSELPSILILDFEGSKQPDTATQASRYLPFLCTALGPGPDGRLTWYAWQKKLSLSLPEYAPFPCDRIVIGHNSTSYDRRHLSCEYAQAGPSSNVYLDTKVLGMMVHGISSGASGLYGQMKQNKEAGLGIPAWASKASRLSLDALVEHRFGEKIDKGVRENFSKLTQDELNQAILDRDNLHLTPHSVFAYCIQDVWWTYRLFADLYREVDSRFISHPATWAGMALMSGYRVYMDGLDRFIDDTEPKYQEVCDQLAGIVRELANGLLTDYSQLPEYQAYADTHIAVGKLEKKFEVAQQAVEAIDAVSVQLTKRVDAILAEHDYGPVLHSIDQALEAKEEAKSAKDPELKAEADAALKSARAERQKAIKAIPAAKDLEGKRKISVKRRKPAVAERKYIESEIKQAKVEKADALEKLIAVAEQAYPFDWGVFSSGPRKSEIKWYADLRDNGWSIGNRDAVYLFDLHWDGVPIHYAPTGERTGSWFAGDIQLPHPKHEADNLGSPFCTDYIVHVQEGRLTSPHFSQESLKEIYGHLDNIGQWKSYRDRYRGIYRVRTEWGELTTTDVCPVGTVSRRATSSTFVVAPKKSEKLGSEIQNYFQPGKGRVAVYADFAAQESKLLAALTDCKACHENSNDWSKAVLTGDKKLKMDIHNVVASHLSSLLEAEIVRQDGKELNFQSTYGAGATALAENLRLKSKMPKELADKAAIAFLDYLKGPNGIAKESFAILKQASETMDFRTTVLGVLLPDSLNYRFAAGEFATTRGNYPIQSGCVDLLHIVLLVIWALCQEYGIDAWPMVTIHDSLTYSVAPDHVDTFKQIFNFTHAVAKQCSYQGGRDYFYPGYEGAPQLWCPSQDLFFEEIKQGTSVGACD